MLFYQGLSLAMWTLTFFIVFNKLSIVTLLSFVFYAFGRNIVCLVPLAVFDFVPSETVAAMCFTVIILRYTDVCFPYPKNFHMSFLSSMASWSCWLHPSWLAVLNILANWLYHWNLSGQLMMNSNWVPHKMGIIPLDRTDLFLIKGSMNLRLFHPT